MVLNSVSDRMSWGKPIGKFQIKLKPLLSNQFLFFFPTNQTEYFWPFVLPWRVVLSRSSTTLSQQRRWPLNFYHFGKINWAENLASIDGKNVTNWHIFKINFPVFVSFSLFTASFFCPHPFLFPKKPGPEILFWRSCCFISIVWFPCSSLIQRVNGNLKWQAQ